MLLKRKGFPEVGDLLLCKVTNIQYNSVFVVLEEYENKSGMIHISEVSAGRIKNIREFVVEGKVIICKVLNINEERGYIDLSLRRVSKGQQRMKADEMKQEQRAEKLIEFYCQQAKRQLPQVYDQVSTPLFKHFAYVFQAFDEVVKNNADLSTFGVPKDISEPLSVVIKENIKPREIEIKGVLSLESYHSDGLGIIAMTLEAAHKKCPAVDISYAGGGKYNVVVHSDNFKDAEKMLKDATETAITVAEKAKAKVDFKREET
jgi:translation initiation factor 2 subunit 1